MLAAASRLLHQRPVADIAIEAIAREAGRPKPLIYRHWPSRIALLVEAFVEETGPIVAMRREKSAIATLRTQVRRVGELFATETGRIACELIAVAAADPEAQTVVREALIEPRRAWVREIVALGQQQGELRIDLDTEAFIDAVYAPFYYRLLVGHRPIDGTFADTVLETVLEGAKA